jgi:L-arabinose isomerase
VLDKVSGYVKAACAARSLAGSRAGSIGGSFDGMGDFLIDDDTLLSRFGVSAVYPKAGELDALRASVTDAEVEAEMKENSELFYEIEPVDAEAHAETARNCIAVRKFIENNDLDAFTINFRKIGGDSGINAMPFIEACKAMARGIGYAGEGDILTASLVGALLKSYSGTAFAEIFCPDWKNDSLLISHMGEYNLALTKGKPGMKKINFIYGENTLDPVVSYGCYRPGQAVFINLYKSEEGYKLFISPIEMLDVPEKAFEFKVRGWFKPSVPMPEFLEKLSNAGATHHSAIIYDSNVDEMKYFASLLGLPTVVVE